MIGNLRWPETRDVAIVNVALDGLAQTRSSAGGIDLPARKEGERTASGDVRLLVRHTGEPIFLESKHVAFGSGDLFLEASGFTVYRSNVFHCAFLSAKTFKYLGFFSASVP
jgi:hypothetical protein